MAEIIPAVLEETLPALREKLLRVKDTARAVQIDVVDGIMTPNKTWPYGGRGQREEFEKIISEESGLPLWEDFNFEADLMVGTALPAASEWLAAGASRIVLHMKSKDALEAARALQEKRGDPFGVLVGLALLPSASPKDIEPFVQLIDFVQVMGIERIGFQGEALDERAILLLSALGEAYPALPLQVDGGVRPQNARKLAEAGASRLIVGSAIFESDDPKEAFAQLSRTVAAE